MLDWMELSCLVYLTKLFSSNLYYWYLLDDDYEPIKLESQVLSAKPRDMNSIPGYSGDKRVLSNLINDKNMTTNVKEMWMIPFCPGKSHFIYFKFRRKRKLTGINILNFLTFSQSKK